MNLDQIKNLKKEFPAIKDSFRDFTSMDQLWKVIRGTVTAMSWGIHNPVNMDGKALRFNVQGHHHKGHVWIMVNGADLFDIVYTTSHGNVKMIDKDVYVDVILQTIDQRVEKIEEYEF